MQLDIDQKVSGIREMQLKIDQKEKCVKEMQLVIEEKEKCINDMEEKIGGLEESKGKQQDMDGDKTRGGSYLVLVIRV
jgi:hypothetical protein